MSSLVRCNGRCVAWGFIARFENACHMIPLPASRSLAVSHLFSSPFRFVAPSFQRSFAWTVETAERLLEDVTAAAAGAPDEIYFLGALLLVRVQEVSDTNGEAADALFSGSDRVFEIIDGQQRLVTLSILIAALRDLTIQTHAVLSRRLSLALVPASADRPRVQLRGPDDKFFTQCIGAVGACLSPPQYEATSEPQRRIVEIRDFFVQQLANLEPAEIERFAAFVLDKCAVVAIVTNTIDRAYQMFTVLNDAGEPLTRNDILKAELIGQLPAADRGRATDLWDDLELRLGSQFEQLFSIVRTRAGRGNVPIVEAIRAEVAATRGGAAAFVFEKLGPAGRIVDTIWRAEHQGTLLSAEINARLRHLGWLSGTEWVPPLLAYWARHGTNAAALLQFLTALERFAYGVRIQGLGLDKRTQRMGVLTAFIEASGPVDGPWPALQFTRDDVRAIGFSLRDLYKRSPQICRLVLMRLDEHFSGAPSQGAPTIEHILPLKVAAGSQWRVDFPDADVRQRLACCLGNLTLVSAAVNERAANHDFAKKRGIYFAGAGPASFLLADLRNVEVWTPTQIEQRLQRLTEGLEAMWRFGASTLQK